CQTRKERSRAAHRRFRLSMAAISAFRRPTAGVVPSRPGGLRGPVVVTAPRQPHRNGGLSCAAHAEGAGPDEPADSSCDQRYHRNHGLAIIDAILSGERDPEKLAQLRDPRIRATSETIAKSLVGDYRREHLFTLRQAVALYREYQRKIVDCEAEMQELMKNLGSKADPLPLPAPKESVKKCKVMNPARALALREEAYRILGVDLTTIPGVSVLHVQTILAELGPDFSKFRSAAAFSSWMGLCPDNDISGGKVLWSGTRRVKNRIALTLRLAAQSLQHSQSALGEFYRRMRAKLGAPKAITAAAHKLARIVYHLLTTRQSYDDSIFTKAEERYRRRAEFRLKAQAQALGFTLTPATISGKEVPQKQRTRRTGDIRKRNLASAIVVRHPETS